MIKLILGTHVDKNGKIQNIIDHAEIINQTPNKDPDVYFAFLIKTLIDDFGLTLNQAAGISQEQFEARFIENLIDMMGQKTRENKQ